MEELVKKANILKAMGHPTRLKILYLLSKKEMCVCELLPKLGVNQPNLSQHLALLRNLGIVKDERKGNTVYYSLKDEFVKKVIQLVD
ncbi:ArsR family transcriptional regulator [Thermosipho affectus]|uniref:ArsR family transcriptional regulator n=1 Tax=Thermosipho affectus TaxID=660294 RepID=A0ABX3IHX3_9BACT|nr:MULTISPECIES: metalloregulator ArsR/SmtB family transcription factor [Thermosipho]ANQ53673.1 ArsR family transcriptional regulator [Thermosipho sp. 1070]APT72119.1 ArsR family transcriptional regulator [Thermosipho sp. 1063]ONN27025.1 ArsR family transcriptional regulator [Thermosipho affectus]OOC43364.1 ArsR family transcriptional regulator [Thermosipho sp. 1074]